MPGKVPEYTQSVLYVETGVVVLVENGKLADGFHTIKGVLIAVLTIPTSLPARWAAQVNPE